MKEIYSKYKERLINISSRNRSLVMRKVYKKRAFDLYRLLSDDYCVSEDDLLHFIENRVINRCLLFDDPYKMRIEAINGIEEELNEQYEEEINKLESLKEEVDEYNKKVALIEQEYKDKLAEEIEKIGKKMEKLIDYSTSLSYLDREIKAIEKETGRYELFLGYPFTEGTFQDGTFVRSPLLLFPIKIEKENNKWYMTHLSEEEILINKVFIFGYSKYNEIKLQEFEHEFASLERFEGNLINGLLKYLYDNRITIQDTKKREI
ncbi:MAG: DUF4011 domain-containing protein [Clostridia bacterium]